MADDHQQHVRGDDADARGEHDYGNAPTRQPEQVEPSSAVRAPNTYAAGENGTQQVTTRRTQKRKDPGRE
jgi:hypothetical protein